MNSKVLKANYFEASGFVITQEKPKMSPWNANDIVAKGGLRTDLFRTTEDITVAIKDIKDHVQDLRYREHQLGYENIAIYQFN